MCYKNILFSRLCRIDDDIGKLPTSKCIVEMIMHRNVVSCRYRRRRVWRVYNSYCFISIRLFFDMILIDIRFYNYTYFISFYFSLWHPVNHYIYLNCFFQILSLNSLLPTNTELSVNFCSRNQCSMILFVTLSKQTTIIGIILNLNLFRRSTGYCWTVEYVF